MIAMKKNELLEQRNYITTQELRDCVYDGQISLSTINRLIRAGEIPTQKMGRKNLIPVAWARTQLDKGGTFL
jgi:excisionase family DNA binding protein